MTNLFIKCIVHSAKCMVVDFYINRHTRRNSALCALRSTLIKMVSITKCTSYEMPEVLNALAENINNLGGLSGIINKGDTVAVKLNLVSAIKPERAATTHPAVCEALAKLLLDYGAAKVIFVDSPGGAYSKEHLSKVYRICGITAAAEKSGAVLNEDFTFTEVSFKEAAVGKRMEIINALLNADAVINVAKMKAHSFTGYTGAVKNLFGAIPGMQKVQMHSIHPNLSRFCDFLIDIEQCLKDKIKLHIIDGIIGMEGAGPTAGQPVSTNVLISSANPYHADLAMLKIMAENPLRMPLINCAAERNLIKKDDIGNVQITGADINGLIISKFKKVKTVDNAFLISKVPGIMRKFITSRPKIKRNCKGCGKCVEHCPQKTMFIKGKKAKIKYKQCISCYCCQELCPFLAVKIKTPLFAKIFRK